MNDENPRSFWAGLPFRALPKERGTLDVKKHFDTPVRRAREEQVTTKPVTRRDVEDKVPTEPDKKPRPIATTPTPMRRFPVDDVKDSLVAELNSIRKRLERKAPEEVNVKVFVLQTLQDMLAESDLDPPSSLILCLERIKADYQAFLPKDGT